VGRGGGGHGEEAGPEGRARAEAEGQGREEGQVRFLDPDRNWRSWDKVEHVLLLVAVTALLDAFLPVLIAALVAFGFAVGLEAGQWDTARNPDVGLRVPDGAGGWYYARPLGRPGFGFGLLDLAAGLVGIGAWLL